MSVAARAAPPPSTGRYHGVYRKLGIRSRDELLAAFKTAPGI
jgi:hypothetical protein